MGAKAASELAKMMGLPQVKGQRRLVCVAAGVSAGLGIRMTLHRYREVLGEVVT